MQGSPLLEAQRLPEEALEPAMSAYVAEAEYQLNLLAALSQLNESRARSARLASIGGFIVGAAATVATIVARGPFFDFLIKSRANIPIVFGLVVVLLVLSALIWTTQNQMRTRAQLLEFEIKRLRDTLRRTEEAFSDIHSDKKHA